MEKWNGFPAERMTFEDHEALVILPERPIGRLAIKTEYWNAFPEAEIKLVRNGYHLCFIANDNRWGTDPDLDRKARFVRFVQEKYGLGSRCVPVGMSCGGLIAIKLAAKYPELMDCLYLDAPVVNYMSCPCGFGVGNQLNEDRFAEIMKALELSSIGELLAYRDMPLDHLDELADSGIPVILVAGDSDKVVPFDENGIFLKAAYEKRNGDLAVYIKPGCDHHPHGLPDPEPIVSFILNHHTE